ncbi:MAG: HAMP domain-containing protein [Kofleriaceae bacterium]|nr:HAMP domain-containing protein [Myxococcales bacterium]MCB9560951.1 HAMP domain-containing protein [Kofleriaceae bacterium]
MALVRDGDDVRVTHAPEPTDPGDGAVGALPFKRRLVWSSAILGVAEVVLVAMPLWTLFDLDAVGNATLFRLAVPVLAGAIVVWGAAMTTWLMPVWNAVALRRRGARVPKEIAGRAYRATLRVPLRALMLRTTLWAVTAAAISSFLVRYEGRPVAQIAEATALAALHAFILAAIRAAWLAHILGAIRIRLFTVSPPLRRFTDAYFRRLILTYLVVAAGTLGTQAAFLYYFIPISLAQYLQIQTYLPVAALVSTLAWVLVARRITRTFHGYLEAAQGGGGDRASGVNATMVYRRAQSLPYRLAMLGVALWILVSVVGALMARLHLRFEVDDTIVMLTAMLVVGIGASIYESLWHRDTMHPLLSHLSVRYRVPVRGIKPALSLRTKLLLSFGGVVLLACGMALLWGFVQYKNLATQSTRRQADLGLAWLRSEIQAEAAASDGPPNPGFVREALRTIGTRTPEASAVLYYLDDGGPLGGSDAVVASTGQGGLTAVGGGPMGAPKLPWYAQLKMRRASTELLAVGPAELAGRTGRLRVAWHGTVYDLGAVAVLYPDYRGRSASMVRPLRELLVFFVILFGACAGIVVFTVAQFVSPIRQLEQRADSMARGELADPVSSGGEGDEIGRLTFALEEMRRALREKLRSTEEVNLDLERAVQMRTADLARKNRELAETLDKLTRTQNQLVRSEKMASIGQLVAGIAHEINNPVNAIVNTVGPLEEAIGDIDSDDDARRQEAAGDIREMVRVVQRGAQRTKAIVQALHNYSRTDDENLVDFDLNRSLDDSLELLRHLLKQHVTVQRRYGEVGRIRGHAGQINQVFMNLLTNAAQAVASRDDAVITIDTAGEGDHVVVTIGDNGAGIPPDVLPRIFDPFFTTKEVGEGTGLGLSIVHELVERHGGTIDVHSDLGVGTTFTVQLPRHVAEVKRERATTRSDAQRGKA